MSVIKQILFSSIFLGYCNLVSAQLQVIPVSPSKAGKSAAAMRSSHDPLTLPFWDDFNRMGRPDTNFWQNSENVFVNAGLADDPPSLYVASFDGLDENGNPYGSGSAEGLSDSLTSRPIDLSAYNASDDLFISFFYQFAGRGDQPEPSDSLRLEFKAADGRWEPVWPVSSASLNRTGAFQLVILPVTTSSWFHDSFQFRFQAAGRLSGAFDIWNVDYVYMNENRNGFDNSFPDRTISEPLTGFLGEYYRVPYEHFKQEQLTEPSFRLRNMVISATNQNKAYNYYFSYDIDVTDTLGNTTNYNNLTFIEPLESPVQANSSEIVTVREPLPEFGGDESADSARVTLGIILDAEDNVPIMEGGDYDPAKFAPIDFQENDTLFSTYIFAKTYAYDDGTAEQGAGLNTTGDRLAYQYTLAGVEDGLLTGMEIYFPFTGGSPDGKQLELTVWQDEGGTPGPVIFRQLVNARLSPIRNEAIRYEFARPVLVGKTFYIGYRQNSPGALAVGLDQNTTTGDKLFYNLGELWEQNTLVTGSLMLRPVFDEVDDVIVGIDDEITHHILPYPNPSADGVFYLHTQGSQVYLTDISGREVRIETQRTDNGRLMIRLSEPTSGIYLLHDGQAIYKVLIP